MSIYSFLIESDGRTLKISSGKQALSCEQTSLSVQTIDQEAMVLSYWQQQKMQVVQSIPLMVIHGNLEYFKFVSIDSYKNSTLQYPQSTVIISPSKMIRFHRHPLIPTLVPVSVLEMQVLLLSLPSISLSSHPCFLYSFLFIVNGRI